MKPFIGRAIHTGQATPYPLMGKAHRTKITQVSHTTKLAYGAGYSLVQGVL